MAIHTYVSNRLEQLADDLARVLRTDPSDPLVPETIVVQSQGMDRWLTFALANRLGITAHIQFPFPRRFISDTLSQLFGPGTFSFDPWEPALLLWEIMQVLPQLHTSPSFAPIAPFLSAPDEERRRYELATAIAATFDHYLIYRPEMVTAWDKGKEKHWQAELWREIRRGKTLNHPVFALPHIYEAGKTVKNRDAFSPHRVSLFGVSFLPPSYLRIIAAFSSFMDVNFFLLNPCQEYWGDILSAREASHYLSHHVSTQMPMGDLHLEAGNALLSSLGKQGREFFDLWEAEIADRCLTRTETFIDPGEDTLLHQLQRDILNLRGHRESPCIIDPGDRSLQIHSCHGPMREMEVLQDLLLDFFRLDPTLKTSDILVMAPDMESYAPFVHAVFTLPEDDPRWIPIHVIDSPTDMGSTLTSTFFRLGKLPHGRFRAGDVCALLECPAARRQFTVTEEELEVILTWVREAGIRWGKDESMRGKLGLPALKVGTWKAGWERMLLGYVLPPYEGNDEFLGIIPYGEIDMADRDILAKFLAFYEAIEATHAALEEKRSLTAWADLFGNILETHFAPEGDGEYREVDQLRGAILLLRDASQRASYEDPISAEVAYTFIERQVSLAAGRRGFLSGGVTFCNLVPMRNIPVRILCLVGMNFSAFPRQSTPPSFDLLVQHPRPGDPSRRYEDRYIFLEALISARDQLVITYCGQSPEDNTTLLPSVVISELIDYLETQFSLPGSPLGSHLITPHHLQAFHPAYFRPNAPVFSYSPENWAAAVTLLKPKGSGYLFLPRPLAPPEPTETVITLDDLYRFCTHPCRYLVRDRLNITLEEEAPPLEDEEPFQLDPLTRYQLQVELIDFKGDVFHRYLASGRLPYGTPGRYYYEELKNQTNVFRERLKTFLGPIREGTSEPIDITVGPWRVTGTIKNIHPSGIVYYRPVTTRGHDLLRAWMLHLAFHTAYPDRPHVTTTLVFWDRTFTYHRPADPQGEFARLLALFVEGCTRPVKLFPSLSLNLVERIMRGTPADKALKSLRKNWEKTPYNQHTEGRDPYNALCFGDTNPLDDEFCHTSLDIYTPLLCHRECTA